MTTFLSSIQSQFTNLGHGRYIALILKEIGNRHPALLAGYICNSCEIGLAKSDLSKVRFDVEVTFQGKKSSKRADLAMYMPKSETPICLIEIKYFDKLQEETATKAGQLADYLHWCKRRRTGRYFLLLSREVLLPSREAKRAQNVTLQRWGNLARYFSEKRNGSELVALFVDYLKGEGVSMQSVDRDKLQSFCRRILCKTGGSGKNSGNAEGPTEFSKLLNNMRVISEEFSTHTKAISENKQLESRKRPTIDFEFLPWNPKLNDSDQYVYPKDKRGGIARVFARHNFNVGKTSCILDYGFELVFEESGACKPVQYAAYWGNVVKRKLDDWICERKKIALPQFTDKADSKINKIEANFRELIHAASQKLLNEKIAIEPTQRTLINGLVSSIRKNSGV